MDLPFKEIPLAPETYSAGNIVARMIDGLGYRYHWATEGLSTKDLQYKPSENGRTTFETLEHLYGLSVTIGNSLQNLTNIRPYNIPDYSFEKLRKLTLKNLSQASTLLHGMSAKELGVCSLIFKRRDVQSEFTFWHLLNGPLADAIYHTGQLVVLRRASGNPISQNVNVFTGKNNR